MTTKETILIVEDEENISDFIATSLRAQGYRTVCARTAAEGITLASSLCPELILLDLGLPDQDGLEVIRSVRSWSLLPIVVISARSQEKDKVEALDLGADDYVTKPVGVSELSARVRTALRHGMLAAGVRSASEVFRTGGLTLDFGRRQVKTDGNEVHLTQVEYKIVAFLARNAGRVMTYDAIISHVWGPYMDDNNRILRVNMANIRRKLEKNPAEPAYIFTEIGVGYRMAEEDSPPEG
ncbi:MAG: response regulator transcription factor [Eubacteriales bacterium]|nr:response regulator transcription factor [Eubacteriales bacterium]